MIKTLTCIVCPVGCTIKVEMLGGEVKSIDGFRCPRGRDYGISECLRPVRTLTTTVYAGEGKMLPVKTDRPVPREKLFDCMAAVNRAAAAPPVEAGAVIIENIAGTGANLVAVKNMR